MCSGTVLGTASGTTKFRAPPFSGVVAGLERKLQSTVGGKQVPVHSTAPRKSACRSCAFRDTPPGPLGQKVFQILKARYEVLSLNPRGNPPIPILRRPSPHGGKITLNIFNLQPRKLGLRPARATSSAATFSRRPPTEGGRIAFALCKIAAGYELGICGRNW